MTDFSFVANAHPNYIESLYQQYKQDPDAVDLGWQNFFKGFEFAASANNGATLASNVNTVSPQEWGVRSIIRAYRSRGHLISTTNPLRPRRDRKPNLDLANYGLSETDMDKIFAAGEEVGLKNATLRQILEHLQKIYCANIGFECVKKLKIAH